MSIYKAPSKQFAKGKKEVVSLHEKLLVVPDSLDDYVDEDGFIGYTYGSGSLLDTWANLPKELTLIVLGFGFDECATDDEKIPMMEHSQTAVVGSFEFIILDGLCEMWSTIEEFKEQQRRNPRLVMKRIKEHYRHLSIMDKRYHIIGIDGLREVRRVVHALYRVALVEKIL